MSVVVVGGKATLAPQLETLGMGPFEERDAYGNLVTAKPDAKPAPKSADAKAPSAPTKK